MDSPGGSFEPQQCSIMQHLCGTMFKAWVLMNRQFIRVIGQIKLSNRLLGIDATDVMYVMRYSPAAHGGRPLPMGWVY